MESGRKYRVDIKHEDKVVEILFHSNFVPFSSIKEALLEVREYLRRGYRVRVKGYLYRETREMKAFIFALELIGKKDLITFANKSRYSKVERRMLRRRAIKMRKEGFAVKEISKELGVPLKTVYRWLRVEAQR